jgi:hypothetical protein
MTERIVEFRTVVVASSQSEARDIVNNDRTACCVVARSGPRAVVFQCPCGCGDVLVINTDEAAEGRVWLLRRTAETVSLAPSVWRTTGCRSHFIVWRNEIWWCSKDEEPEEGNFEDLNMWRELLSEYRRTRHRRR